MAPQGGGTMYNPQAIELRSNYPNAWTTELVKAPIANCPFCCVSILCPMCVSYHLRVRSLYNDLSRYQCCGGFLPCSGHCGERKCPAFCLCQEVFWCFPSSVASTRFIIQDQLNLMNTKCDNCIIGFMFFLQQLACIVSCIACICSIAGAPGADEMQQFAHALNCIADLVYCSVCACMQTQHKVQLDVRDGKIPNAPAGAMSAPPQQTMK